ncbi:MAG: hypothetical protein HC908_09540 [Calothrix sp. SM1_7_51]|nr:hypothetical protein [Calothrix sp. SM1_7_51]
MHHDEIFQQSHLWQNIDINQSKVMEIRLVEIQQETTQPKTVKFEEKVIPAELGYIIPITTLALWAIAAWKISNAFKHVKSKIEINRCSCQTPCKNCKYFADNFYLKCAIHPSTVLTKEQLIALTIVPEVILSKNF